MIKTVLAVSMLALGLAAQIQSAAAAVPTAPVCQSFARYAVHWNTRARQIGCSLPRHDNMHFNERAIFQWCMSRPNDDRHPEALGHKGILERHCRARL